jgi:hypothetical protein
MLEPIRDLAADPEFWEQRSEGLAIFVSNDTFRHYRVPLRLHELVVVNARFQVKPLLSLLDAGEQYLLLTLSQNRVRLWQGNRFALREVEVGGLPENKRQALNYDGADRGSQVHSAMQGRAAKGKQGAVFHGQGGSPDAAKDDLEQYFRVVDASLRPVLRANRAPLLLAGVDYLLPIYRKVNRYAHLAGEELAGNCDHLTAHQLHDKAWPLIEPRFDAKREEDAARFRALAGTGKTSDDIRVVAPAALQGKVDVLFFDRRDQVWGAFDEARSSVELREEPQPGDDDLLDFAAVRTALSRGSVYAVERRRIPADGPVAAIFRY